MAGAGYHDFVAGETLTASNVDSYLMEQSVMVFATSAARDTALSSVKAEGMLTYQKDSDSLTLYDGSDWSTVGPLANDWTAWTPSWTGLTTTTATIAAKYQRIGRTVLFNVDVEFGASTAITGDVSFTLPFNLSNSIGIYFGGCNLYDATGPTFYIGAFLSKDADEAYIRRDAAGTSQWAALASNEPFTWTTNDRIRGSGMYIPVSDA
jgi:hypothetical protein